MATLQERARAGRVVRRRRVLSMPAMIGLAILGIAITVMALPTMSVFVIGMMPGLVSYIADMTPGRYAFRCVVSMNFCGVAPFLRILWSEGNDMTVAMGIITDPYAWLVFYGTAAFGWGLFYSVPGVISAVQTLSAERRVAKLRAKQIALAEEWGTAVTGENWKPPELPAEDRDGGV